MPNEIRETKQYTEAVEIIKTLMPQIDKALDTIENMCDENCMPLINGVNGITFVSLEESIE